MMIECRTPPLSPVIGLDAVTLSAGIQQPQRGPEPRGYGDVLSLSLHHSLFLSLHHSLFLSLSLHSSPSLLSPSLSPHSSPSSLSLSFFLVLSLSLLPLFSLPLSLSEIMNLVNTRLDLLAFAVCCVQGQRRGNFVRFFAGSF